MRTWPNAFHKDSYLENDEETNDEFVFYCYIKLYYIIYPPDDSIKELWTRFKYFIKLFIKICACMYVCFVIEISFWLVVLCIAKLFMNFLATLLIFVVHEESLHICKRLVVFGDGL